MTHFLETFFFFFFFFDVSDVKGGCFGGGRDSCGGSLFVKVRGGGKMEEKWRESR